MNMNVCLFFEGTGQGVAGKYTNVTRLYDACVADERQVSLKTEGPLEALRMAAKAIGDVGVNHNF